MVYHFLPLNKKNKIDILDHKSNKGIQLNEF